MSSLNSESLGRYHGPLDAINALEDAHSGSAPHLERPGFFAVDGFLFRCLVTPLFAAAYVSVGCWAAFWSSPLVITWNTQNATEIKAAFTIAFGLWNFLALAPAIAAITDVRGEEWWRRLIKGAPFYAVDDISSNKGGLLSNLTAVLAYPRSSIVLWLACVASIAVIALQELGTSSLQVLPGRANCAFPISIPALPENAFPINYSQPFNSLPDYQFHSRTLAPSYMITVGIGGTKIGPSLPPDSPATIVPIPNVVQQSKSVIYDTDIAQLAYECEWSAPQLAAPNSIFSPFADAVQITAGGIIGWVDPPQYPANIAHINSLTDTTTGQPVFDGTFAQVVYGGTMNWNPALSVVMDLQSVAYANVSTLWQMASQSFQTTNFGAIYGVPTTVSAIVCTPSISIAAMKVSIIDNQVSFLDELPQLVGNLDELQVGLAIQDSLTKMNIEPPMNMFLLSSVLNTIVLLDFDVQYDGSYVYFPRSARNIAQAFAEVCLPNGLHAYLDGSPFGAVDQNATQIRPAIILTASKPFLVATGSAYLLLSLILVMLFFRRDAVLLSLQAVVNIVGVMERDRTATDSQAQPLLQGPGPNLTINATLDDPPNSFTAERLSADLSRRRLKLDYNNESNSWLLSFHEPSQADYAPGIQWLWTVSPVLGATFVAFGIFSWRQPIIVTDNLSLSTQISASFTLAMGIWRTWSLIAANGLIRQTNSDEWSRILREIDSKSLTTRDFSIVDTISSNRLSFIRGLHAAWLPHSGLRFKVAYFSTFVVIVTGLIGQAAISLVPEPTASQNTVAQISAFLPGNFTKSGPWIVDSALNDTVFYDQTWADLGGEFIYIEYAANVTIGNAVPAPYIVPIPSLDSNSTASIQYRSDVAELHMQCTWTTPLLEEPPQNFTGVEAAPITVPKLGIHGIMPLPRGVSASYPIENMTYNDGSAVTSGLFVWILFGGSAGDAINLQSVPSTQLSPAWQEAVLSVLASDLNGSYPEQLFVYPTAYTALVCDPGLSIIDGLVTVPSGGKPITVSSTSSPAVIGNLDLLQTAFLVYMAGASEAENTMRVFRPNLGIGFTVGSAVLIDDPSNPGNGTIPKSGADISTTLEKYLATALKAWMFVVQQYPFNVSATLIEPQLVVATAPLHLFVVAGLYIVLGLAAFIMTSREKLVPFTVAGIVLLAPEIRMALGNGIMQKSDADRESQDTDMPQDNIPGVEQIGLGVIRPDPSRDDRLDVPELHQTH